MTNSIKVHTGFSDLIPVKTIRWEKTEENQVVLLVPKFRSRFAVKYILPRLKKPDMRIKLDAFGSHVWMNCDGNQSVKNIADSLRAAYGSSAEPADQRTAQFIRTLSREKFITLYNLNSNHKDQRHVTSH